MINSRTPPNYQSDMAPLWKRLAEVFPQRHAIVSEAELLTQLEKFNATESEITEVIDWIKERHLVAEPENNPGYLELTPQGRRLWRELMGEI